MNKKEIENRRLFGALADMRDNVAKYFYQKVKDYDTAQDLAHDALFLAMQRINRGSCNYEELDLSFKAWVFRKVALPILIDYQRSDSQRFTRSFLKSDEFNDIAGVASPVSADFDEQKDHYLASQSFWSDVKSFMPHQVFQVLRMQVQEGLSDQKIAKKLKITQDDVHTRREKAYEILRQNKEALEYIANFVLLPKKVIQEIEAGFKNSESHRRVRLDDLDVLLAKYEEPLQLSVGEMFSYDLETSKRLLKFACENLKGKITNLRGDENGALNISILYTNSGVCELLEQEIESLILEQDRRVFTYQSHNKYRSKEEFGILGRAFSEMPQEFKAPFVLYFKGSSIDDLSQHFECSVAQVRYRIGQATNRLKDALPNIDTKISSFRNDDRRHGGLHYFVNKEVMALDSLPG